MDYGGSYESFGELERSEYERFFRDGYLIGRWVRAEIEKEEQVDININISKGLWRRENIINELRESVDYDDMTGLMRRSAFLETVEAGFKNQTRVIDLNRKHSILFMDLDDFGPLNKSYGHNLGDECLKFTGNSINRILSRVQDFGCRWGGEEFVVFLGDTDEAGAEIVARNIQNAINDFIPDQKHGPLGISIGIAELPHNGDIVAIIDKADKAMGDAKKYSGKNQILIA
jgi:diguanylate cyclase (GGDEF)-like protein